MPIPGVSGQQIVAEAQKFLGDPYVYGAEGPSTFDCSGLMQYVYGQLGITIPRTTYEQYKIGAAVPTTADLQPGDLVFTEGTPPGHVGMYIGGGNIIQAPHTGAFVEVTPLADFGEITAMRRVLTNVSAAGGGTGTGGTQNADSGGGILNWPSDITNFFKSAEQDLTGAYNGITLFFQPSTYIRIGAGIFGIILLITGTIMVVREARA